MNHRCWMLGLAVSLGLANVAFAAGGTVRPAHAGSLDYIYVLQLPDGPNDRAITRYGNEGVAFPNGSEFDPNSVICGGRTRSGHQSNIPVARPLLFDIRLEDPNNPGFPDVLAAINTPGATLGPLGVGADSNPAPAECPANVSYQLYAFNGGLGVRDPLLAVFITWVFPGAGSNDPCYLGLETRNPDNRRCKYYVSPAGTYGQLGANHWNEIIVFTPFILDLNFRMHGSSQFAGDAGQKVWFIRGDEGGTCVDDFISTTLVVDNGTGGPIGNQVLTLVGDRSVINPKLGPKDLSASFRLLSNPKASLASGNPYNWGPGRTRLDANIPATINGKFQAVMPVNLPFIARSGPQTPPGPFDDERQELGLRRQRGNIDDGSAEAAFIVVSPALTGDVLAQYFPLDRLFPKCGASVVRSINITRLDIGSVSTGGRGGFDAVEVRRTDPVIVNSSDQSPQGRLGGSGTVGDGMVGLAVPVDPNGNCALIQAAQAPAIAVSNSDDIWINVYPAPGDTVGAGTFLCADQNADTILFRSYFSPGGPGGLAAQPYTLLRTSNFISRAIFTPVPFTGPGDGEIASPAIRQTGPLPVLKAGEVPRRVLLPRQ